MWFVPTHTGWWVCLLAGVTACAGCVVDGTLTPSSSLVVLLSVLQVAHQGFADDVLQAQVTGWVTKGVIPGVDAAYKSWHNKTYNQKRRNQLNWTMKCLSEFHCYLLELVTAGKLKISVPGWAFPARQLLAVEKKTKCLTRVKNDSVSRVVPVLSHA